MRNVFRFSRYGVFVAVIGLLLAAIAVFIFGGITTIRILLESFQHGEFNAEGARILSVELIEVIDLFLLGTVLYITSIGLQELFVDPGLKEVIPEWMSVSSLDQLKFNLLAVIVVMLAVLFLGIAAGVELAQDRAILGFGLAVGLVITSAGITAYLFARVHHMREEGEHQVQTETAEYDANDADGVGTATDSHAVG